MERTAEKYMNDVGAHSGAGRAATARSLYLYFWCHVYVRLH